MRDNRPRLVRSVIVARRVPIAALLGAALLLVACDHVTGAISADQPVSDRRGADVQLGQHDAIPDGAVACRAQKDCETGEACIATVRGLNHCQPAPADYTATPRGPQGQPAPPLGMLRGTTRFGAQPER